MIIKTRHHRIDLFRLVGAIVAILALIGMIWLAVSWIDVILHNCTDQVYAGWNAWIMIFGRYL